MGNEVAITQLQCRHCRRALQANAPCCRTGCPAFYCNFLEMSCRMSTALHSKVTYDSTVHRHYAAPGWQSGDHGEATAECACWAAGGMQGRSVGGEGMAGLCEKYAGLNAKPEGSIPRESSSSRERAVRPSTAATRLANSDRSCSRVSFSRPATSAMALNEMSSRTSDPACSAPHRLVLLLDPKEPAIY